MNPSSIFQYQVLKVASDTKKRKTNSFEKEIIESSDDEDSDFEAEDTEEEDDYEFDTEEEDDNYSVKQEEKEEKEYTQNR